MRPVPGVDVPACLVLMSVVKDAERIGDYCKNVLDAAKSEAQPLKELRAIGRLSLRFALSSQQLCQTPSFQILGGIVRLP